MTKREFLNRLETAIMRLPKTERDDIINDYEEHFRVGAAEGKSEQEVAIELGSPEELGASFLENAGVTNPVYVEQQIKANNSMDKSVKALLIVLLVIFVGFPLASALFGFVCGAVGIIVGFLAAAVGLIVAAFYTGGMLAAGLVSLSIAFIMLSVLGIIGFTALCKLFAKAIRLCVDYIKKI